jgi:TldD protein
VNTRHVLWSVTARRPGDRSARDCAPDAEELADELLDRVVGALGGDVSIVLTLREILETHASPADPVEQPACEIVVSAHLGPAPDEDGTPAVVWSARVGQLAAVGATVETTGVPILTADLAAARVRRPLPGVCRAPVLLDPQLASAAIHACIGHTAEADNFAEYGAELGLGLGDRWTAANLDVLDTPDDVRFSSGYRRDDEGTPASRTHIVTAGIWTGLLTSRHHRPDGSPLTGNGRCDRAGSGARAALPRNSTLVVPPGPARPQDLLAQVRDGYVCGGPRLCLSITRSVLLHAAWARRIRDGELTDEVFGVEIRARKAQFLSRLVAIGSDTTYFDSAFPCDKNGQHVPVTLAAPTLLFDDLLLYPHELRTGAGELLLDLRDDGAAGR